MSRIQYQDYVGNKDQAPGASRHREAVVNGPVSANEIEASVRRLPVLPAMLHELMQELRDQNADIRRLEERISSDPSLTTRVLKMANSPFYVRSSEVVEVSRAVVTLGFRTVANLVMAAGLRNTITSSGSVPGFVNNGIFMHSLAVGLGCARLSTGVASLQRVSDHLFVAGLLHDIGRVALTEFYVTRAHELSTAERRQLLPETEQDLLGTDHQKVGALVHERWGLPEELLLAITAHHAPLDEIRESPLPLAVSLVDCCLNQQGFARSAPQKHAKSRVEEICTLLDIEPEWLEKKLSDVGDEVSSITGAFA